MNKALRDAFARELDDAGRFDVDVRTVVERGETRLRRRRLTAVVGAAAAIAAVAIGVTALTGNETPRTGPSHDTPRRPETPSTRQIVYSDVRAFPGKGSGGISGDSIHVGDRVVDTGSGFIKMDVTDDGVVYTTGGYEDDGRVWFTAGGRPVRIGSHACAAPHGAANTVVTGNTGSLAAWFDCTRAQDPQLVVYDTKSSREIVRERLTGCGVGTAKCFAVDALIGDHVYLTWTHYPHGGRVVVSPLEFDMGTDRISKVKLAEPVGDCCKYPHTYDDVAQPYLDDIRSHPRGLVIGDSWETGTPTAFGLGFSVVGNRLVPESGSAFDTATRRSVRLTLPTGYHGAVDFRIFEWLDDDAVALVGPDGWGDEPGYGDILTCRLSVGHCDLVARGHGPVRLTANGAVPG